MKLGMALPIVDIGGEPETLREFAEGSVKGPFVGTKGDGRDAPRHQRSRAWRNGFVRIVRREREQRHA
jgi:hypothetical protein